MVRHDDPEQEPRPRRGLSKEAWTAISAIVVAIITGIFTLLNTLYKPSAAPSSSVSKPELAPSSVPPRVADLALGSWSGTATQPSGPSFPISVSIAQTCRLNVLCGVIAVPHVRCKGDLLFVNVSGDYAEFDVSNFDASSDPKQCKPGGGELLRLLPDGNLAYKASYSQAEGVLRLQTDGG